MPAASHQVGQGKLEARGLKRRSDERGRRRRFRTNENGNAE